MKSILPKPAMALNSSFTATFHATIIKAILWFYVKVFPDGWALVRASNTQPMLVMRFEADTPQRLKQIQEMVEKVVNQYNQTD